MTTIEKKKLPHGNIPFTKIRDVETRAIVMKVNENINILASQIKALQDATIELQRR